MAKPLSRLNPRWLGRLRPNSGEGVGFTCPACGPSHMLVAYFTNPVDGGPAMPMPDDQKWEREGADFSALTVRPSLVYPCWHGWVERGQVIHVSEGVPAVMVDEKTGEPEPFMASPMQADEIVAAMQREGKG